MMEIMQTAMDVLLSVKLKTDGDVGNKEEVYVQNSPILLLDRLIYWRKVEYIFCNIA